MNRLRRCAEDRHADRQALFVRSARNTLRRWVGIKGIVRDNPNFAICRSQQDVEILGIGGV